VTPVQLALQLVRLPLVLALERGGLAQALLLSVQRPLQASLGGGGPGQTEEQAEDN
jgi:hypothetical protein